MRSCCVKVRTGIHSTLELEMLLAILDSCNKTFLQNKVRECNCTINSMNKEPRKL